MNKPDVEYSDELANEILARIPAEPLTRILSDEEGKQRPDMPSYTAVMNWRRTHPAFGEAYLLAREDQGDYDADQVTAIARDVQAGKLAPDAGRVAIDAAKWTAGRRRPKVYGDKLDVNLDAQVRGRIAYRAIIPRKPPTAE